MPSRCSIRDAVSAPNGQKENPLSASPEADWQKIAASPEFRQLIRAKLRFIVPATVFFVLYYFALPYLVGYHTAVMQRKVWGEMNLAYLFALSQFLMAWVLAAIYVFVATGWDRKAAALLTQFRR